MQKNEKKALMLIEKKICESQERLMRFLEIKARFDLEDIEPEFQVNMQERITMIGICNEKIRDCERILASLSNIRKAVITGKKNATVYTEYDEVGSLQRQINAYYRISIT